MIIMMDEARKREPQMIKAVFVQPTEHVAVSDRSLQQGVLLCVLHVFIHTLDVF